MFILVNPNSGGGTALEKWQRIENRVADIIGPFETADFGLWESQTRAPAPGVSPAAELILYRESLLLLFF